MHDRKQTNLGQHQYAVLCSFEYREVQLYRVILPNSVYIGKTIYTISKIK